VWKVELEVYSTFFLLKKIRNIKVSDSILEKLIPKKSEVINGRLSKISAQNLGQHNLAYALYLINIKGLIKKLKFIALGIFIPPRQLVFIETIKSSIFIPFYYLKRIYFSFIYATKLLYK